MEIKGSRFDKDLQKILWACYQYWSSQEQPEQERSICYSWIIRPYKERFGSDFHQSKLAELAKLGFLDREETSRGGRRRYYRIVKPNHIQSLLSDWGFL